MGVKENENNIPPSVYLLAPLHKSSKDFRSKDFRLLRIFSLEPVISCELITVSLHASSQAFVALSYAWRNALYATPLGAIPPETCETVICNGVKCRILDNLYQALLQFGKCPNQYLWVDAICINQQDLEEKTAQVKLMAEIYEHATRVSIWLGKGDNDTERAFQLIRHLGSMPPNQLAVTTPDTLDSLNVMNLLEHEFHQQMYWVSLARLLRRRWFSRALVVQEVILANPDGLLVHCGEQTVSWYAVRAVSSHLSKTTWRQRFEDAAFLNDGLEPPRLNAAAKIGGTQDDIVTMTKASFSGEPHDLFLDTLIRVREFDCERPRDKAYCCYGVGIRYRPRGFVFPEPDYGPNTTDAEAFTQTGQAVLRMSQSLHVLAYAESLRADNLEGKESMPSWVPDWSIKQKVGLGITGYRRYSAAGNLTQTIEFADGERARILRLRAAKIDQVALLGNSKDEIARGGDLQATCVVLRRIRENYRVGPLSEVQPLEEVFWRTLVMDTCPGTCFPARSQVGDQSWPWLLAREGGAAIASLFDDPAERRLAERRSIETLSSEYQQHSEFGLNYALRTCLILFCTNSALLGVGAEAIKPGDSIWIVPGSRVPLILRPRSTFSVQAPVRPPASQQKPDQYRLVGAAYIHGLMRGESMERQPPLNFQTLVDIV